MSLDKQLAQTLVRNRMLAPGDAVLVGVSGGPDSVALLHFLHESASSLGLRLEVAHVEHGIRGRESRDDADFVRDIAAELSLPFHLQRLDLTPSGLDRRPGSVEAVARRGLEADVAAQERDRPAGNLEALAREGRYRFFAETAVRRGIGKVAVGHNRDDQVETMLMWLLRGCGPEGLTGMPAVRPLAPHAAGATAAPGGDPAHGHRTCPGAAGPGGTLLIRPLLEVSRGEILDFLESRGLDYREDRTNRDTRYLRNWIRGNLLPGLRERSDHGLERRLARLGVMLRADHALLERQVADAYPRVAREDVLDRAAFMALEPGLRPRMVRFWLRRGLGTLRRIGFAHVEAVLRIAAGSGPHGKVSLPGAWTVVREYDSVRLIRSDASPRPSGARPSDDYSYELPLEGALPVPEAGVRFTSWRSGNREPPHDPFEAAFDLDRLRSDRGRLRVRNFRPGDRFRPLGMTGHKKLKDLFIDRKVPRSRRRTLPLLLAGEEIVWVPGCARSDFARLEPATREVWRVKVS